MSQTEKLLRTLSTSGMLTPSEDHFVIGKDRNITVPNSMKRLAVQNDHDVEVVTFDCPRFWDGQDMSKMTIYINYIRADRKTGIYRAENVIVDKHLVDVMHFTWTISRNVSEAPGKIAFQICIKKVDGRGIEVTHWNSEVYKDCFVSESLNCSNEYVAELLPDIIEQWYKELMAMCDSGEFDGPQGYSPIIEVIDIQGGHRIAITDTNGTQQFDVMDTFIDSTEAVQELLDRHVHIGGVEPLAGPALWFRSVDGSGHELFYKDSGGNITAIDPVVKLDNVIGAEVINQHIDNKSNPHSVTPEQIGLVRNYGIPALGDGAAYTANVSGITTLIDGISFMVVPTVVSTAVTPTLNVNNLGAKAFVRRISGGYESLSVTNPVGWLKSGIPIRVTLYEDYWIVDDSKPDAEDLHGVVKIQNGGTEASDAKTARKNLGAAAEDHEHNEIGTLMSYFVDGEVLRTHMQSCDNTDFNDLTSYGAYYGSTEMTNAAVNDISVLEVIPYNQDWIMQRQTRITTDLRTCATYVRFKQGGEWSAWKRMMSNVLHPDDYGDEFPADGVEGQVFYMRVGE